MTTEGNCNIEAVVTGEGGYKVATTTGWPIE